MKIYQRFIHWFVITDYQIEEHKKYLVEFMYCRTLVIVLASKQEVGKGKGKAESELPSSTITNPAAPAANAVHPLLNPSQYSIFPLTRDTSKESSKQNLHFMMDSWAFSVFRFHTILNFNFHQMNSDEDQSLQISLFFSFFFTWIQSQ